MNGNCFNKDNGMKSIYRTLGLLLLASALTACVKDLGSDSMVEINEIEISGIEESYSVIAYQETLTIKPEIKGSLAGFDESNLSYKWFLCNNALGEDHKHITIGTERDLNYFVETAPRNYMLYFSILDNSTGLKWETATELSIVSPYVRGHYIVGDKADGSVGIDFLSFIEGRDTIVMSDIFVNTKNIKGAKNAVFTGTYYSEPAINLWVMSESGSYQVENSASLTKIKELDEMSDPGSFIFPTIPVSEPQQVMDIIPHALGKSNSNRCRGARVILTKDNCFATSMITLPEAYGNPINRYSSSSAELFRPSKYVLYRENQRIIQSGMCLYDKTNHCFSRFTSWSSYSAPTLCAKLSNDGPPFYFDQTKYSPVRDMVYGENGYGNSGRSYALMSNENGEYFVYWILVEAYNNIKAQAAYDIDLSSATEFAQATNYAFYSMQPIILYSVGAKLYAYDYIRKDCKLIKTFEDPITYLAMDYSSNDDPNHFFVATYGSTGKIYGFDLEDNQNAINVTPVEREQFETDLKVVRMVYRNHSN